MRYRTLATLLTSGMALAAVAGCGSGAVQGTPSPGSATAGAASSTAMPYGGAPNIDHPLDGTPLVKNQCSALTTAETATLGATVETATPNKGTIVVLGYPGENGCFWDLTDGMGRVTAGPTANYPLGLSGYYKGNQSATASGGKPTIKELPAVEGYPTVQSTEAYQGDGGCITLTGLSNTQLYVVKVQLSGRNANYSDPCGLAEKVAGFAINKLKGA